MYNVLFRDEFLVPSNSYYYYFQFLPIYNDAIVVAVPRFSGQNLESIHEPSVATSPND